MIDAALSEVSSLKEVLLKHPRDAFGGTAGIEGQWRELGYTAPPDPARAADEYDRFAALLARLGASITWLPADPRAGLDSIYVRDAAIVSARGIVLCRMGKEARAGEPQALNDALRAAGVPIAGAVTGDGRLEGGDVVWLDARTVAVGRGYRSNDEGIRQLARLLDGDVDEVIPVPLPHWRGPSDVFHLMSIISPIDRDLALVHSPLMPVPFRERLLTRGCTLVEVPGEEMSTLGGNVLAVAPRRCVMLSGNPVTRARLERAGAEVHLFDGGEICLKGSGGPTCLTRPLRRD